MHQRWLCTGDCNIRLDLLLLYPVLLVTSIVAVIVGGLAARGESGCDNFFID
jgi:hypothetical protein